jgi:hypothetical protein
MIITIVGGLGANGLSRVAESASAVRARQGVLWVDCAGDARCMKDLVEFEDIIIDYHRAVVEKEVNLPR